MGYPNNELSIEIHDGRGGQDRVQVEIRWCNSDGFFREKRIVSFTRKEFEQAMANAEITIPWKDVLP